MKRIKIILISMVMVMLSLQVYPITANDVTSNKHYNIELVIDTSGSLRLGSDKEGTRFTAIDIFLQTIEEKGNHVGAVVFNDDIMLDTDLKEMTNQNDKNQLSDEIASISSEKDTNIGLGLQRAVNRLENINNDLPSIILLISDGNTDLDNSVALDESLKMKDQAVQECISKNIPIYGICLNHNGSADINEFTDMTQKTNGAFLQVTQAEGLVDALRSFYAQIFNTSVKTTTGKTDVNGYLKKAIEVPAYGIKELNITISNASKVSSVVFTKPSGATISSSELSERMKKIGDYYFVKLSNPFGGTWIIELYGSPDTEIQFDYVYNAQNKVILDTNTDKNFIAVGKSIQFNAYFIQNDMKLSGPNYYSSYQATLVLDKENGSFENAQYYSMNFKDQKDFVTKLSYNDIGSYKAYAVLKCGDFETKSDVISFTVGNSKPEFLSDTNEEDINIKKLFKSTYTINLNNYFKDKEDQNKLEYEIITSSYNNLKIDNGKITLDDLSEGKITVKAIDSAGNSCIGIFNITILNLLPIIAGAFIFAVMVVIGIILYKKNKRKKLRFDGILTIFAVGSHLEEIGINQFSRFKGKIYFKNLAIEGLQFDENTYIEVIPDKTKGKNKSKTIQIVSSRDFYIVNGLNQKGIKKLQLKIPNTYEIRSQRDVDECDDSIQIMLEE